jgi:hypothetical protein
VIIQCAESARVDPVAAHGDPSLPNFGGYGKEVAQSRRRESAEFSTDPQLTP